MKGRQNGSVFPRKGPVLEMFMGARPADTLGSVRRLHTQVRRLRPLTLACVGKRIGASPDFSLAFSSFMEILLFLPGRGRCEDF